MTAVPQIEELTPPSAAPTKKTLGAKIVRSVSFGALRYVLLAPIPFFMTPFILRKIGVAGYGTWAVFLAINSLTSMADLGLVGTLSKFVAEHHAQGDFAGLSRLLSSALAVFLILALTAAIVMGGVAHLLIASLFKGATTPPFELIFLLRCFLVVIIANVLILLLSSVVSGLQRLDITYIMGAANIVLAALGSAAFLLEGWGLRGLVYAYSLSAVMTLVAYVIVIRRLLPDVSLNPLRFEMMEARRMLGFSLRLYVIQATFGIQNQIDKAFLALLIGVAPVGWFDIAGDVSIKVRAVMGLILGPVLPAASELNALGDRERTKELYYRTHKYLALIGIPVVVCANAFTARFIDLWLGPSMSMVALPMSILITVSFINLASGPGFLIFAGRGHLKPAIQSCALGIVLNVILSLALIYKFGFAGAAIGTSVATSVAALLLIWKFHRESGYPAARMLRESYLKPTVCALIAVEAVLALQSTRTLTWLEFVLAILAFGTAYATLILVSQFFDAYDWNKIEGFFPAARYARRIVWNA